MSARLDGEGDAAATLTLDEVTNSGLAAVGRRDVC